MINVNRVLLILSEISLYSEGELVDKDLLEAKILFYIDKYKHLGFLLFYVHAVISKGYRLCNARRGNKRELVAFKCFLFIFTK